ncbi:ead/Ea22-like family protein [Pseudomonas alliivorans]|nr:ead/Ea22-like family protein [Pseudomonas alliivorans]
MTVDIEKLKELAGKASKGPWRTELAYPIVQPAYPARGAICSALIWPDAHFIAAANPAAVLELIADSKQQAQQFKEWQASHHANYVAAADERDDLRAEVEGLKTGYEAYERVNAELRAECEKLRKSINLARHWCDSALRAAKNSGENPDSILDIKCLLRQQARDIDAAMSKEASHD